MSLYIISNTYYLTDSHTCSRAVGNFYFSDKSKNPKKPTKVVPTPNGAVHTATTIMKNVVASAAEAKYSRIFIKGHYRVVLITILEETVHPKPQTPRDKKSLYPKASLHHPFTNAVQNPST